ncbi:MAG: hypothetical protein HY587_06305 [Candidatus Omnitrophica bacterium]|nr:hypothetical protein [Candidatus Omnitrophota bacterium]
MTKPIIFTKHALLRMVERGTNQERVVEAVQSGERESAQRGLAQYRLNFEFNRHWDGKFYPVQQVVPIAAEEMNRLIIVTVYVFYF